MTTSDLTPVRVSVGDLAYVDTLGPLLPCKILDMGRKDMGAGIKTWHVQVRLTAERGAYKRGEVIWFRAEKVPPRKSVYTRSGMYRVRNNWHLWDGQTRHNVFE